MGIGSFFKDVGDGVASGLNATTSALNAADRYINPFHVEQGSTRTNAPNQSNFLGIGKSPLGDAVVKNVVMPKIEWASQKANWLYDNGVSQPISTALLAGDLKGGPLSAHNWAVAWHAANHISFGQALLLGSGDNNPYSAQKAVGSPLTYYKPGAAQLPPGFDQLPEDQQEAYLKQAGMPATGNAYVDELRQTNSMFKNASGVADFALRWEGDPTTIALGGYGKLRAAKRVVTRPTAGIGIVARPGAKIPLGIGKTEGGWSKADIDKLMSHNTVSKAIDFVYQNKDNPALLNNLALVKDSALGPRFGAIASQLKTPDEVHDFLRVTMGDVDAIESLQSKNISAAARIAQDTDRVGALGLMHTRYASAGDSRMTGLIDQQMADLNDRINGDTSLVRRYNEVLDHAHEFDKVNLSKWQFAQAQDATAAQAGYRASTARGAKVGAMGRQVTVTPLFFKGKSTPVDLGFAKTRLYGAGDFFSSPVTMVRSLSNARPAGYMRIDDIDKESTAELRGQIARIPGISQQARLNMLNEYLKTQTEGERLALLKTIGATGAAKVAEKHGLEPSAGLELYQEHLKRQFGEIDNMKRYSAATKPITLPDGSFARVNVDEFADDGGKLVVHPNLVTRLANDHVFQDLDEMDKVLARHSSALSALRTNSLGNADWINTASDYLSSMWKFGTLFRLGYIPRVASDDLAGQVARLGAANMALRAGWGVKNAATNLALGLGGRRMAAAQAGVEKIGVSYADDALKDVQAQIDDLTGQIARRRGATRADLTNAGRRLAAAQAKRASMDETTPAARVAAMDQLIAKHQAAVAKAGRSMSTGVGAKNIKLQSLRGHQAFLERYRGLKQRVVDDATATAQAPKAMQGTKRVMLPGGIEAPAAFEGENGQYFYKQISSDEVLGQLFLTNKQLIHGHLMRSFDNGAKAISPAQDEALHAVSWAHAINAQLMQDPLAIQAVRGASPEQMAKWLKSTAEGRDYQRRLGMNPDALPADAKSIIRDPEDLANSAWHDVAEYMPTPEIRQKALEGSVDPAFLKESVPVAARPDVHTGQVGGGARSYYRAMDKVMAGWYKFAATLPADRLSRHPLFNQLYEGHMKTLAGQLKKQGAYDTTAGAVEDMASTARRLALKDTRGLVFDIAHRSDAAAALRFISPFFAATSESFQRWARIIADKPATVGYAANFYNSPAAAGHMQDADGNSIDRQGYAWTIDPKTHKAVKTMVPKSQRYIVGRMPKWAVTATGGKYAPAAALLGASPAGRNLVLSQNSMDLVTQGDPWWNPGVGPIVQIPVNQLVKDKPRQAELARHLGILPYGPQTGNAATTAAGFLMPSTVKNFLTAYDTSDQRYQQVKLQIMQRAMFEHQEYGKPMPSPSQIAKQTKQYWLFSAESAFLQPMATQKADPYQYYRDQYNALQRANPLTADDEFLKRFGPDYFVFAQSMSKNNSGAPATTKAVELSKKYGDLIGKNPDLAALIIGPEGNGPFSPEAYAYQLNTPVTPGGAEMQRTKMSADDAMADNQRRKGWSDYTQLMNGLGAALRNAGFKSYSDKGAEQFKATKAMISTALGSPTLPNGQANPYYNDAWSRDFNTLDSEKYERLIPGLQEVASSPLAKDPNRSDLRVLQNYLAVRHYVTQQLAARKRAGGSGTITAQSNADLLTGWQHIVDGLVESNTNFGDLHSRYLSRDLGYNDDTEVAA